MLDPYDKFDKKTLSLIQESGFKTEGSGFHEVYLSQASRSVKRAIEAKKLEKFEEELAESASSIIFSALACEAVISEYITHFEFSSSDIPEEIEKLRRERKPIKKWKALLKYSTPDLKLNEIDNYLKLSCLFKLRNVIVHRNARMLKAGSFPKEIAPCISQKVIPEPSEFRGTWINSILNPKIAQWSYNTAKEWLEFSNDYVKVNDKDV